jgi:GntR family transcriptional regulator
MMAKSDGDHRPKYQQIADDLRAAIQAGDYGPGDRLPGEADLMGTYGVARMTARQAQGVLKSEGLVVARKGAGVFVRSLQPLRRRSVQRLSEEQWGNGRSIWEFDTEDRVLEVDQLTVTSEPAPQRIARVLADADRARVCVRRRRYVLDGKPAMLATSYLLASVVKGSAITREDTGPGGTYARLADLGRKPVHFREELRLYKTTEDEAERLRISPDEMAILICRTAFTADGHAVEITEMILDAALYILEYEFDA